MILVMRVMRTSQIYDIYISHNDIKERPSALPP
jgi:hypothetical protein